MCITRPAFAHMALPFPTGDRLAACPALHECGSTSTEVYCNFSEPGQYSFLFACQSWNARLTPLSLPDHMIKRRPDLCNMLSASAFSSRCSAPASAVCGVLVASAFSSHCCVPASAVCGVRAGLRRAGAVCGVRRLLSEPASHASRSPALNSDMSSTPCTGHQVCNMPSGPKLYKGKSDFEEVCV